MALRKTAVAAATCVALTAATAGCSSGSDTDDTAPSASASERVCLTDLSTSTATLEVDLDSSGAFLTGEAAVIQGPADAPAEPQVLGRNPELQEALEGARVWAVAGDGFLVSAASEPGSPVRLDIIDSQGRTVLQGPTFDRIRQVQVVGPRFVVDDYADVTAYDVSTGGEVEAATAAKGTTRRNIASSIVLVAELPFGAVLDAETGEKFSLRDMVEPGNDEGVSIAGSGADRVLLKVLAKNESGATFSIWDAATGLREAYTSTAPDTTGSLQSPGVCGEYVYLAEFGELRVIDSADGDAVMSARPLVVDESTGSGYDVLAIPGGVLIEEVVGDTGARRFTWFDE